MEGKTNFTEEDIKQHLHQKRVEDELGRAAASTPMPGPMADAFAIQPNIKVGPYDIRPFYDFDFEVLQLINHPLYRTMAAARAGKEVPDEFFPSGQAAWSLAWIMTTNPDDVEQMIQTSGQPGL